MNKNETVGTEGQGRKVTGPQDDERDKAGRSETKPHLRKKTRRYVRMYVFQFL